MYESRREKPISTSSFLQRLAAHLVVVLGMLGLFLVIGMLGYGRLEGLTWRDSFLNAAMLLGGMSPVHVPQSGTGKLFTGAYAMTAGLVFIAAAGILLAPVFHRIIHTIYWDR